MTRKEFIIITEELSRYYDELPIDQLDQVVGFGEAVQAVMNALQRINPRFDDDKFYKAIVKS